MSQYVLLRIQAIQEELEALKKLLFINLKVPKIKLKLEGYGKILLSVMKI
jgi:hypothetical protein